uniref:Uncharacterized protein n=1 Tax=Megaselia scalaris TaxID=36166 RepID=T1GCR1_MEGSC
MYMAVMGLLSVILVLFCDLPNILSNAPRVNLPGQGDILGSWSETAWTNQKFQQFLSIPYAESPKGSLHLRILQHVPNGGRTLIDDLQICSIA